MELFAKIRRDRRIEGLGTRRLAERYGVGRDTVRLALKNAEPPARKVPARESPRLGPFKTAIDEMLRADLTAPRKQRHTATRIWNRLIDEHGSDVSYPAVRDYVRARRREILEDAGDFVRDGDGPAAASPGC